MELSLGNYVNVHTPAGRVQKAASQPHILTVRFNVARSCCGGRDSREEDSPLTCEYIRRMGIPGCRRPRPKHKIPTKAHKRLLAWRHKTRGQGQGRTADLPLFRRTLIPTELPDLGWVMIPARPHAVGGPQRS